MRIADTQWNDVLNGHVKELKKKVYCNAMHLVQNTLQLCIHIKMLYTRIISFTTFINRDVNNYGFCVIFKVFFFSIKMEAVSNLYSKKYHVKLLRKLRKSLRALTEDHFSYY